ncbi:MAG TPA: hypothetical protein VK859_16145, partial [bacterium]|nr:hypothetical protein [bacterium]
ADQQGGQRPAAYLEYGAGGMQNAMGGAAVAGRNDVADGFWNPAGLSGLRGFQVENQYTLLSLGQQLNYLAFANGYRDMFFYGLSFFYYSAGGDIEARTGPTLEPDSVFGDTEMTFLASVAFRLDPQWSIGVNVKVLAQSFNNFSAFGLGEDLGIQCRLTRYTTLGLMIQDPLTFMSYDNSTTDFVPPAFKAGISLHDPTLNAKMNFDLDWSPDLGLEPHLGVEWRPVEVLALRAGCWGENLTAGASGGAILVNPSAGIGIFVPMGDSLLQLDYTLLTDRVDPGDLLQQISVTGKFL